MTIYISGPIAHHDLAGQKRKFSLLETQLQAKGYKVINPFRNGVPDDAHWSAHMRVDIGLLLSADAIILMPGWEQSKGCKLELDVATTIGLPVYFQYVSDHYLQMF